MKAIVYERYGPPEVMHPADMAAPVPGRHDVVVRVRATTVIARAEYELGAAERAGP